VDGAKQCSRRDIAGLQAEFSTICRTAASRSNSSDTFMAISIAACAARS
jgi:hypothetical protein